jgi:hypothetical protein
MHAQLVCVFFIGAGHVNKVHRSMFLKACQLFSCKSGMTGGEATKYAKRNEKTGLQIIFLAKEY